MPLADFASDLHQIADDWPSVIQYDGLRIKCVVSEIRVEVLIDERGDYDPTALDVITSLSDWRDNLPADRATVTVDGVKYYVDEQSKDAKTNTYRLTVKRI